MKKHSRPSQANRMLKNPSRRYRSETIHRYHTSASSCLHLPDHDDAGRALSGALPAAYAFLLPDLGRDAPDDLDGLQRTDLHTAAAGHAGRWIHHGSAPLFYGIHTMPPPKSSGSIIPQIDAPDCDEITETADAAHGRGQGGDGRYAVCLVRVCSLAHLYSRTPPAAWISRQPGAYFFAGRLRAVCRDIRTSDCAGPGRPGRWAD